MRCYAQNDEVVISDIPCGRNFLAKKGADGQLVVEETENPFESIIRPEFWDSWHAPGGAMLDKSYEGNKKDIYHAVVSESPGVAMLKERKDKRALLLENFVSKINVLIDSGEQVWCA